MKTFLLRVDRSAVRNGFTLIELLVVIAIIAILASLIMPAVQQAREAARKTQNRSQLKQIGIALHNYHNTHKKFPPGWVGTTNDQDDVYGVSGFGWAAHLLPELEQSNLYEKLDFSQSILSSSNTIARETYLSIFRNPSDSGPNYWTIYNEHTGAAITRLPTSNYVGNFGTQDLEDCEDLMPGQTCKGNGMFFLNGGVAIKDVADGTSTTLHVGDRRTRTETNPQWFATWVGVVPHGQESFARILGVADHTPNNPVRHIDDFSSPHTGGVFFLFVDGHVRWVSDNINLQVYQRLATRNGGEVVGEFE